MRRRDRRVPQTVRVRFRDDVACRAQAPANDEEFERLMAIDAEHEAVRRIARALGVAPEELLTLL